MILTMLVSEKSIMMWIASRLEVQRDDAYHQSMFITHEMIDKESSTHSRGRNISDHFHPLRRPSEHL